MLLNADGWHSYFWIAFIPFFLLLAVGTKLQPVITQLAHEVAEKHIAIEGELIVQPAIRGTLLVWQAQICSLLDPFHPFPKCFRDGIFFWIWVQYGFTSCIMGKVKYIIPRIVIGVFIQVLCSYSTLPLYAIVTQILQTIVLRAQDKTCPLRSLSTKEFRHFANKVGNLECPFLKEFFPRWVEFCGCPVLRMGFSYNKWKNVVELAVLCGCTGLSDSSASIVNANPESEKRDGDNGWT